MSQGDVEEVEDSGRNTTLSGFGSTTYAGLVGARNTRIFAQSLLQYFQYNITLPVTNIALVLTVSPNALAEVIVVLTPPFISRLTYKN